jgi:hypothetical protein
MRHDHVMPGKRRQYAPARIGATLAVLAAASCATPEQQVAEQENLLSAAGFVVRPASSPARQNMLRTLPPHQFLMRAHGDTVSYVYSDPLVCGCLYVGSQEAYNHYRLLMQQQKLADEQQMTAQMYNNAAWDWGAWGPWGPGFAFGPGPGW